MADAPVVWVADYEEDGQVWFRIGTLGHEVIAEWSGLATLIAERDGKNPRLTFRPGADPRDIEKIRRGSAWLLLRQLEGNLAMHGSAIAKDGKAIVFLGRSGAGKSTIAAAMCFRGAELLADDAVAIEPGSGAKTWTVLPREIDHWLDAPAIVALGREPSGGVKEPLRASHPAQVPARLVAFVELSFAEGEPSASPLHGIEAVGTLVPQVARFVLDEPERQRSELDLLHSMVDAVPIIKLERPRRFDALARTVELAFELLEQGGV